MGAVHGHNLRRAIGLAEFVDVQFVVQRLLEQRCAQQGRVERHHYALFGTPVLGAVIDHIVNFEGHGQTGVAGIAALLDRVFVDVHDDRCLPRCLFLGQRITEDKHAAPGHLNHVADGGIWIRRRASGADGDRHASGDVVLIDAAVEDFPGDAHDQPRMAGLVIIVIAAGAGEFDPHVHHFRRLGRLVQAGDRVGHRKLTLVNA
ncbi:hypothetical protein PS925_06176 [Pseudomonas fluorescens]|uniref:Uncharacterized protein n=1 Tax=Pseudomonas fluorescens TaxID=294 RepID=A0A5E7VTX8_PSEFL|nr:hypothetical protein PS925_06176 [Pseudomonas fluorescens]